MNQWKERIKQFLPDARIGIIQQKKKQVKDKDIVIGMVHSISMKDDYEKELFDSFGLCIYDEIHLMATKVFSKAFMKVCTRVNLGLST